MVIHCKIILINKQYNHKPINNLNYGNANIRDDLRQEEGRNE